MRRLFRRLALIALVALLAAPTGALAARRYYIDYGDGGIPIGWFQEYLGVSESYVYSYSGDREPYFGDATLSALRAYQRECGLTVSGRFDAKTLYAMLDLPAYSAKQDPFVWIPMHGGTRYHLNYACSNLYEPREMPMTCAEALGFYPCARCCY